MADLQFNEEQQMYIPRSNPAQRSFLARLVLGSGIVDTEQGVQYVLLGITISCVVATIYIVVAGLTTTTKLETLPTVQDGQYRIVPAYAI